LTPVERLSRRRGGTDGNRWKTRRQPAEAVIPAQAGIQ
jgi:hypothetical protein